MNQVEKHGANLTIDNLVSLAASLHVQPHQLIQITPVDFPVEPQADEIAGFDSAIRILRGYPNLAKTDTGK